jgi:hypothetical protein
VQLWCVGRWMKYSREVEVRTEEVECMEGVLGLVWGGVSCEKRGEGEGSGMYLRGYGG